MDLVGKDIELVICTEIEKYHVLSKTLLGSYPAYILVCKKSGKRRTFSEEFVREYLKEPEHTKDITLEVIKLVLLLAAVRIALEIYFFTIGEL